MEKLGILLVMLATFAASAQIELFLQDSPAPNGKSVYRDSMGRQIGTAERQNNGRVIYRDAMGRQIGAKDR